MSLIKNDVVEWQGEDEVCKVFLQAPTKQNFFKTWETDDISAVTDSIDLRPVWIKPARDSVIGVVKNNGIYNGACCRSRNYKVSVVEMVLFWR